MLELAILFGDVLDKLDKQTFFLTATGMIVGVLTVFMIITESFSSGLGGGSIEGLKKFLKRTAIFTLVVGGIHCVVPSKPVYYTALGVHIGKQILNNGKSNALLDKSFELLSIELDSSIQDLKNNKQSTTDETDETNETRLPNLPNSHNLPNLPNLPNSHNLPNSPKL